MQSPFSDLVLYVTQDIDWALTAQLCLLLGGGFLALALLFRMIKGKMSELNHALSSAVSILILYSAAAVTRTYGPADLFALLPPLPFCSIREDVLVLFSFPDHEFPVICYQLLSMVILSFLVNLLDSILPRGEKVLSWYFFRILSAVLALAAYLLTDRFFAAFLPGVLLENAPVILLCILVYLLLLGVLKLILGVALTLANPILGAIYAFFFSGKLGKQPGKAVLTTAILTALTLLLCHFGFGMIPISASVLPSYIPLAALLLILWYLIGHIL